MSDTHEPDRRSGRHRVSIGHLVMGVAFLAIVGIWGLVQTDTVTGDDIHWLMPIPWVLAGIVGLAASAITGPRRYAVRQTGWVGQPTPDLEPRGDALTTEPTSQQADQPPTQPTTQPTLPPASPNADQQ
jgi:hypothetical protein